MQPDLRDRIVDFVRERAAQTELPAARLVAWIGISASKFYDWRRRYGKVNEHNAWIPHDHWLEDWEKRAIVDFYQVHPDVYFGAASLWLRSFSSSSSGNTHERTP